MWRLLGKKCFALLFFDHFVEVKLQVKFVLFELFTNVWVLTREEKVRVRDGKGVLVLLKLLVLRLGVRWEGIFITSTWGS